MKKKLTAFFILLSLAIIFAADVCEASRGARVWDDAGLLTEQELIGADNACAALTSTYNFGVSIVTTDSFEGNDILEWADSLYMNSGFGMGDDKSGILMAVSMEERDWGIVTFGYGETVFNDYGLGRLSDIVLQELSAGDYNKAFLTYTNTVGEFLQEAQNGSPYSEEHLYKEEAAEKQKLNPFLIIMGAFVLSFVISLVIVSSWKKGMNTKRKQKSAAAYLKADSFQISQSRDMFLYRTVNRVRKEKENSGSSHSPRSTSSGGRGVSGKF